MSEQSTDSVTLTVAQTAQMLGISRWLVQQAVRDGSLPAVRLGRRILIPRIRLEAWLDGQPWRPSDQGEVLHLAAPQPAPPSQRGIA